MEMVTIGSAGMSRGLKILKNSTKGFTFLEVLVAIIILTIGMLGAATFMVSIIKSNNYSNQISIATTLAQDKIEELKNISYASITSGTESNIDENGDAGGIYTRTTTVDNTSHPSWSEVTVTVSWNWNNATRNVTLKTIIAG